MKIEADRSLCDGNALCVAEAPDLLELDENEMVVVIGQPADEAALERARRAAAVCPKAALRVRS
jgi:ferredoxin